MSRPWPYDMFDEHAQREEQLEATIERLTTEKAALEARVKDLEQQLEDALWGQW